jgi:hypothetical protein
MLKFSKITLFFAAIVTLTACRKGDAVDAYHFSSFTAELLALPGSVTLDVYVENNMVDSLVAGDIVGVRSPLMLSAGKASHIIFKKAGTDSLVLDTTVSTSAGEIVNLKVAYSEVLGIKSFLTSSDSNIAADSAYFFLFNQLPVELMPDDVKVDGFLFRYNETTFEYDSTGISWPDLEKNKLHPNATLLQAIDSNSTPIQYIIKLRNKATGALLVDGFSAETAIVPVLNGGERQIITLTGIQQRGRWRFAAETANY